MFGPRVAAALTVMMLLAVGGHPRAAGPVDAVAEDIVVVVHRSSPTTQLDATRLEAIFSTVERSGPDGKPIIAFDYPPEDNLRIEFDRVVLHMSPKQVSRYWIDQRIRGGQRAPRQISDPLLVLRLVGKLPGAIGYLPNRLVDGTVRIVARIRAGMVIAP